MTNDEELPWEREDREKSEAIDQAFDTCRCCACKHLDYAHNANVRCRWHRHLVRDDMTESCAEFEGLPQ
jgi:hypothetical protein